MTRRRIMSIEFVKQDAKGWYISRKEVRTITSIVRPVMVNSILTVYTMADIPFGEVK